MDEPRKRSLKFKMLRKAQHDKYLNTCICYSDLRKNIHKENYPADLADNAD